ncbi:UvrD-helicase domain-containing protein [Sediminicola luteus]|uniref:DNA 3'-5' helicase n=1 Tax=Sediminicola luteus TaxID=319238 RepID=A0A2A4G511_9FLAO|nr:UvrD-helicase domain-containing protein [Sediminicola luteus]PCE63054.1 hypothetical protein B7P33_17430 [Sediminicola luteus]
MYFANMVKNNPHGFRIYDASAGSGKTYTLARSYLTLLLATKNPLKFKQILAITFTNKAVAEMKQRILEQLNLFSRATASGEIPAMLVDISKILGVELSDLQKRSAIILKYILHNYAFFDISTIDGFTHRVIRTFAKDLKLPQNFEVSLDVDLLLQETVDRLIAKAGDDGELLEVLVAFAREKAADDKHWDIALDLVAMGKLLFNENQARHIETLANKNLSDYKKLAQELRKQNSALTAEVQQKAQALWQLIREQGLDHCDFNRGSYTKFLLKAIEAPTSLSFSAKWQEDIAQATLHKKGSEAAIEAIRTELNSGFNSIKKAFYQIDFRTNILRQLVPVSVLGQLAACMQEIQDEKGILPIGKFNALIQEQIKDQPAPFIYERLGERYAHYFIDEFQDTSQLQWQNLVPLIASALEGGFDGSEGSLFLVGDAKQSIYRWRGGKAEQFLDLVNEVQTPFTIGAQTENLPKNYRSHDGIVRFNNAFFTCMAPLFQNAAYSDLYEKGSKQQVNGKPDGLARLAFVEKTGPTEVAEVYALKVLEDIRELVNEKGFSYADICILTRKKKDGVFLADYLMTENIPLISSETLLLAGSLQVNLLINLLGWIHAQEDMALGFELIDSLGMGKSQKHKGITENLAQVPGFLKDTYGFEVAVFNSLSLYEGLEYAIRCFGIDQKTDAHVFYLLDELLSLQEKNRADLFSFLNHWESKKDSLAIAAPESDAVRIMTVHKSKGLEFPVVLFPFANERLYAEIDAKVWLGVDPDQYAGFDRVLVAKKKEMVQYSEQAQSCFEQQKDQLQLDAINLLYVALTRAEKGLYIYSTLPAKKQSEPQAYPDLFVHFLEQDQRWQPNVLTYDFGSLPVQQKDTSLSPTLKDVAYRTNTFLIPNMRFAGLEEQRLPNDRKQAIDKGNLLHNLMAHIRWSTDVEAALALIREKENLSLSEITYLRDWVNALLQHPDLMDYFIPGQQVLNEREIFDENDVILRPDRVNLSGNSAVVIDYKTGKPESAHKSQIQSYGNALNKMGYTVEKQILVYLIDGGVTLDFV